MKHIIKCFSLASIFFFVSLSGSVASAQTASFVSSGACPAISYTLYADRTDSDTAGQVTRLQNYLKNTTIRNSSGQTVQVYPEGLITGFFGPLTEQAVERFQCALGIVCSGEPNTTGYGQVGPVTQAAMQAHCGGNTGTVVTGSAGSAGGTGTAGGSALPDLELINVSDQHPILARRDGFRYMTFAFQNNSSVSARNVVVEARPTTPNPNLPTFRVGYWSVGQVGHTLTAEAQDRTLTTPSGTYEYTVTISSDENDSNLSNNTQKILITVPSPNGFEYSFSDQGSSTGSGIGTASSGSGSGSGSGGTGSGGTSTTVSANAAPELELVSVNPGTTHTGSGGFPSMQVIVRNNGGDTGNASFSVRGTPPTGGAVMPVFQGSSSAVGAGQTKTITITNTTSALSIPAGTYNYTITIDSNNTISDSNRNNNSATIAVTVGAPATTIAIGTPTTSTSNGSSGTSGSGASGTSSGGGSGSSSLPDLILSKITTNASNGLPAVAWLSANINASITITLRPENTSLGLPTFTSWDRERQASSISLSYSNGYGGSLSLRTTDIPEDTQPTLPAGTYRYIATVDSTNAVSESNETNNVSYWYFNTTAGVIYPAGQTGTPGTGGCTASDGTTAANNTTLTTYSVEQTSQTCPLSGATRGQYRVDYVSYNCRNGVLTRFGSGNYDNGKLVGSCPLAAVPQVKITPVTAATNVTPSATAAAYNLGCVFKNQDIVYDVELIGPNLALQDPQNWRALSFAEVVRMSSLPDSLRLAGMGMTTAGYRTALLYPTDSNGQTTGDNQAVVTLNGSQTTVPSNQVTIQTLSANKVRVTAKVSAFYPGTTFPQAIYIAADVKTDVLTATGRQTVGALLYYNPQYPYYGLSSSYTGYQSGTSDSIFFNAFDDEGAASGACQDPKNIAQRTQVTTSSGAGTGTDRQSSATVPPIPAGQVWYIRRTADTSSGAKTYETPFGTIYRTPRYGNWYVPPGECVVATSNSSLSMQQVWDLFVCSGRTPSWQEPVRYPLIPVGQTYTRELNQYLPGLRNLTTFTNTYSPYPGYEGISNSQRLSYFENTQLNNPGDSRVTRMKIKESEFDRLYGDSIDFSLYGGYDYIARYYARISIAEWGGDPSLLGGHGGLPSPDLVRQRVEQFMLAAINQIHTVVAGTESQTGRNIDQYGLDIDVYKYFVTGAVPLSSSSGTTGGSGGTILMPGSILVKRVGGADTTASAPANTNARLSLGGPVVSENPARFSSITAPLQTVYVTKVSGYTTNFYSCTFAMEGTECTIDTASAPTLTKTCDNAVCSVQVLVPGGQTLKVVAKYVAGTETPASSDIGVGDVVYDTGAAGGNGALGIVRGGPKTETITDAIGNTSTPVDNWLVEYGGAYAPRQPLGWVREGYISRGAFVPVLTKRAGYPRQLPITASITTDKNSYNRGDRVHTIITLTNPNPIPSVALPLSGDGTFGQLCATNFILTPSSSSNLQYDIADKQINCLLDGLFGLGLFQVGPGETKKIYLSSGAIPNDTPLGNYTLKVGPSHGLLWATKTVTVSAGSGLNTGILRPRITQVSGNSSTYPVVLNVQRIDKTSHPATLTLKDTVTGQIITYNNIEYFNSAQIRFNFPHEAILGREYLIKLTTNEGESNLVPITFQSSLREFIPSINSISPTSGSAGTQATISGTNFNTTATGNTVWFGLQQLTGLIASNNGTDLTFTVPSNATVGSTYRVEVANNASPSNKTNVGLTFTVTAGTVTPPASGVPAVTSFTPSSGAIGTQVTLTGTGFSTATAGNTVIMGTQEITGLSASNSGTTLTFTVPSGLTLAGGTGYQIRVRTSAGTSQPSADSFTVTFTGTPSPTTIPVITSFESSLTPGSDSSVEIIGTGFSATAPGNTVIIDGTREITGLSSIPHENNTRRILFTVPAGITAGTHQVQVRTSAGTSQPISGTFAVRIPGALVTSITTDKESYAPGEKIQATLTVRNISATPQPYIVAYCGGGFHLKLSAPGRNDVFLQDHRSVCQAYGGDTFFIPANGQIQSGNTLENTLPIPASVPSGPVTLLAGDLEFSATKNITITSSGGVGGSQTSTVLVRRVQQDEATTQTNTSSGVDVGTPAGDSNGLATFSGVAVGTRSVWSTDLADKTETAGYCQFPSGGSGCSVTTFTLPTDCTGSRCSVSVPVSAGQTTRVAFKYSPLVTTSSGNQTIDTFQEVVRTSWMIQQTYNDAVNVLGISSPSMQPYRDVERAAENVFNAWEAVYLALPLNVRGAANSNGTFDNGKYLVVKAMFQNIRQREAAAGVSAAGGGATVSSTSGSPPTTTTSGGTAGGTSGAPLVTGPLPQFVNSVYLSDDYAPSVSYWMRLRPGSTEIPDQYRNSSMLGQDLSGQPLEKGSKSLGQGLLQDPVQSTGGKAASLGVTLATDFLLYGGPNPVSIGIALVRIFAFGFSKPSVGPAYDAILRVKNNHLYLQDVGTDNIGNFKIPGQVMGNTVANIVNYFADKTGKPINQGQPAPASDQLGLLGGRTGEYKGVFFVNVQDWNEDNHVWFGSPEGAITSISENILRRNGIILTESDLQEIYVNVRDSLNILRSKHPPEQTVQERS